MAPEFQASAFDPSAPHSPKGRTYCFKSNPDVRVEDPFDLKNLRMLSADEVRAFLRKLEQLAGLKRQQHKKIIAMCAYGGTLLMAKTPQGKQPVRDPYELLEYAGKGLVKNYLAAKLSFPQLMDSCNHEIDYAADSTIAKSWLWKNASKKLRSRLIFLQPCGTDTEVATAIYEAMMLGPDCPFSVANVHAQRMMEERFNEVPANVSNAIEGHELIEESTYRCVFFSSNGTSGGGFRPSSARKIDDSNVLGFEGRKIFDASNGAADGLQLDFERQYRKILSDSNLEWIPIICRGYDKVHLIDSRMGSDPRPHCKNIADPEFANWDVLIQSFGSFTANENSTRKIVAAARSCESPKLVFGCNPTPNGSTTHGYASDLAKFGAIPVQSSVPATIAKIVLGRQVFDNREALAEFVTLNNYIGEQPSKIPSLRRRLRRHIKEHIGPPAACRDRLHL